MTSCTCGVPATPRSGARNRVPVACIGDTEDKILHLDATYPESLGVVIEPAAKTPDTVVHDTHRNNSRFQTDPGFLPQSEGKVPLRVVGAFAGETSYRPARRRPRRRPCNCPPKAFPSANEVKGNRVQDRRREVSGGGVA